MKVLVTVQPLESHIRAIQQVARTLLSLGHEVRVAAPRTVRECVQSQYRLPYVEAGPDWTTKPGLGEQLAHELSRKGNTAFIRVLIEEHLTGPASVAKAKDIARIVQDWHPDAILCDCTDLGSLVAARQLDIRRVSLDNGWIRPLADNPESVWIGLDCHWSGIAADDHIRPNAYPVLTPCPRDLLYPDLPHVLDYRVEHPRRDGERLPAWVAKIPADRPLVYASVGSILTCASGFDEMIVDIYRRIIDALTDVSCTAVLSVGRANVTRLRKGAPEHVRVTPLVPQPLLLGAGVDVILTAGGLGTVKEILTNAIPSVMLPICSEHPATADQFASRGLGVSIAPMGAAEEIAAATVELLDNSTYRHSCVRWQRKALTLPPLEAVLTKLLA